MADERNRKDDLTDDDGKKGKKELPPKGNKDAKDAKGDKKGKNDKEPKEKKKHPVLKTLVNTSIFWLVCMIVFAAFTYLNMFTLKEIVLQALNPDDDYEVMFQSDIQMLKDYETELDVQKADLDQREADINDLEDALNQRESELDEREMELEEKYPYASDDNTQEIANPNDITTVAKALAAMDPAKAAQAITGGSMSQDIAVAALKLMKADAQGAILSKMNSDEAGSIIEMMAGNQ